MRFVEDLYMPLSLSMMLEELSFFGAGKGYLEMSVHAPGLIKHQLD
jgi:hypothetical protein